MKHFPRTESSIALACATIGLVVAARSPTFAQAPRFRVVEVAPNAFAAIAVPGGDAGSNSGFLITRRGVVVFDSHLTPAAADSLLAQVRARTSLPVRFLINSHFHGDHTHGNGAFPGDVEIISHATTRERLLSDTMPGLRLPTLTFLQRVEFFPTRDSSMIALFSGRGHTDGDVALYDPHRRLLYGGDLLFNRMIPVVRNAYLREWITTLQELHKLDAPTVIPGHGEPGGPEIIVELIEYLRWLTDAAAEATAARIPRDRFLQETRLPDRFRDWGGANRLAANLEKAYDDLASHP
ncbi:MAG: MBL fold metallo-hydrolase [Gemmatimonadetes bacterium]|nr:MBL fold metallo-hydrolase [Gemmatimonadota bacterium]